MATKKSRGVSPSRRPASASKSRPANDITRRHSHDLSKDFLDERLSVSGLSVKSLNQPSRSQKQEILSNKSQSKRNWTTPKPMLSDVPSISASRVSKHTNSTKPIQTKPAWLAKHHEDEDDTPRSEISHLDSRPPYKPSLDDFLNYSVETRSSSRMTTTVSPKNSKPTTNSPMKSNPASSETRSDVSAKKTKPKRKGPNLAINIPKLSPREKEKNVIAAEDEKSPRIYNESSRSELKHLPSANETSSLSLKDESIRTIIEPRISVESNLESETELSSTSHTLDEKSKLENDISITPSIENPVSILLRKERAAIAIQKWYRRVIVRKKAGQAAMKRILDSKKSEIKSRLEVERAQDQNKIDKEREIIIRREQKAREARQAAILEMKKSRDEEKTLKQSKEKKETQFTSTKPKSSQVTKSKLTTKAKINETEPMRKPIDELQRPGTASSVGRKVDEIFDIAQSSTTPAQSQDVDEISQVTSNMSTTHARKNTSTTFEDLMSSLKELEEPADIKRPSVSEVWGQESSTQQHRFLSQGEVTSMHRSSTEETRLPGTLLSVDKLRSIMDFLDEVEEADKDVYSEMSRPQSVVSKHQTTSSQILQLEKEITAHDSASQVASEISTAIAAQKMELGDKQKTVEMLQKALNQQRDFTTEHLKGLSKEHKQQMALQRQEYEGTIQRHLSFIDQLIDDKKVLSKRCEDLVNKLKDIDQKYSTKIKSMEQSHAQELKKQKDISEAAEKLRREKWVQEKTKQIKEMTVKGLEPDIQKLITKHKSEIKRLKAQQQGELLESDERAGRRYIQQIDELRQQLEEERDSSVQKERENAKTRFEKQLEQEEVSFQQQRRRLYEEVQEEKERIAQQAQKSRQELQQEKESYEQTHQHTLLSMQQEHTKQTEEMERRHSIEIKAIKEQLEIEKQQWVENFMKKQETQLLSKERELKENVRETRDKEIEMVIARLEKETTEARDECERAAENRIKRVRDKYESEIKDLERAEQTLREKNSDYKVKLGDVENDVIRLRSDLKLKEQEVEDVKRVTEQLQKERSKVTDIIRQEFADRLVATDEDNKRLRTDMSEMKARHRIELERISNDKETEMEEVHKRVKQAISKKESTMQLMRNQLHAAEKRAEHLETLLSDQRKKILS